jgi:hypothetical protein
MSNREQLIAAAVLGLLVTVGIAFGYYQLFLVPIQEKEMLIESTKKDIETAQAQRRQALADRPRLNRWRLLSLPADVDMAAREYEKYLNELLREQNFEASVTPKAPDTRTSPTLSGKKPAYTRLSYTVLGHATLEGLVGFLDKFYHTGLLHQIRNISVQRPLTAASPERRNDLDINLTVEALVLHDAASRDALLPNIPSRSIVFDLFTAFCRKPAGLALAAWEAGPSGSLGPGTLARRARNYSDIATKNVFFGPPPPKTKPADEIQVARFVFLTDITQSKGRYQAFLYDRVNNKKTRLRTSPGFDSFRVTDDDGNTVVKGKVVRIDPRGLIFTADARYYELHIGDSIAQAMQKPLTTMPAAEQ